MSEDRSEIETAIEDLKSEYYTLYIKAKRFGDEKITARIKKTITDKTAVILGKIREACDECERDKKEDGSYSLRCVWCDLQKRKETLSLIIFYMNKQDEHKEETA